MSASFSPTAISTGFPTKIPLNSTENNTIYSLSIGVLTSSEIDIVYSLSICAGLLSLTGSITIVIIILRQNELSSTYGRLIFGMSCMDIMQSIAYCFSTLPAPSSSRLSGNTWPYLGNSTTCSIQGFFLYTGGTGTTIYYCSLCIYYVLIVLKGLSLNSIKHRFESYLHAIPLIFCFTCGIILAGTENFNSAGAACWIAPFPYHCHQDLDTCTRGKKFKLYRWIFQGIPLLICLTIIIISMICLIYKVRRQRKLMQKYQFNVLDDALPNNTQRIQHPNSTSSRPTSSIVTTSKTTTYRALQYIAAFFLTFVFIITNQIFVILKKKVLIAILILQSITAPAQGFFNFIVFILPIVRAVKKDDHEMPLFKVLLKAIVSTEKLDKSKRDCRSKLEKLRKPNPNRKGFTSRELHQQRKDRDAAFFIPEADVEESKEEERFTAE